ncbi:uncharacterized protein LOC122818670 [Drosophila biarmipes]|uniref:uncharacterized protein LOC122818670 n=1 Tax=Drosophila biarmipes TaxID=125945 RepID=UPI0021CCA79D|nr:uncharacterized protein LOC122818670 [Drosophila biarmipes]
MHYAYITNMSKLSYSQFTKSKACANFCEHCLQFYPVKGSKPHDCGNEPEAIYPMPKSKLYFRSRSKSISPPVVLYADIESSLESVSSAAWAASFYIVHYYNPHLNEIFTFDGSDCIKKFCETMKDKLRGLYYKYWKYPKTKNHTFDENTQMSGICSVCNEEDGADMDRFFHQFSGVYLGPVHEACKTKFKLFHPFFPVVFNHLTRFDINLLFSELGKDVKAIPGNQGLYSMFILNYVISGCDRFQIKFLDSSNFLRYNVEKLFSYLVKDKLTNLRNKYPGLQFEPMCQKRVFPQNYLESMEQLQDPQLPEKELFLYFQKNTFSLQDYKIACQVWDIFNCHSIGDYLKIYLERDVIILGDVFEYFRGLCLNVYNLDPLNYSTAPSMSWDAMLKVTKIVLDLISDPEMHSFLKSAVRGGLVQCNQEDVTANNELLNSFDPSKPITYLASIEANNLDDWAMSQPLPFSNFSFLNDKQIHQFDATKISSDADVGYVLEVDLEYPTDLYRSHDGLPFCPQNRTLSSGYHQIVTADFSHKKNYVIHLKHLQLCLQNGLVLTKIHRVLSFNQCRWLKTYIDVNRLRIKLSENEFERNFFMSMNSFIVGKSLENVENHCDIVLLTHYRSGRNSPGFRQRVTRNNFRGVEIFQNNLAAIMSAKTNISNDKPLYIGVTVLEMSKWFMYEHYYNFLSVRSPSLKLIYVSNNLFVALLRENFKKLMEKNSERFDMSNYYKGDHNNTLELMQDKYGGQIVARYKYV